MFGLVAFIFACPITFITNIYLAVFFLWVALFFGGSVLPACSGILVSIIPKKHRPLSSSLSLVVFNMFGYFSSLIVSGMLMQYLESIGGDWCDSVCSMTWGFRLVLFWLLFSLMFLFNALRSAQEYLKDNLRLKSGVLDLV